jgi:HD-GYP domain-containing protein (c-di-GMP phosphodiesterase class II)
MCGSDDVVTRQPTFDALDRPFRAAPQPRSVGDVETKLGDADRVRGAELIAATCLATDLAMGFPFEHGLRATAMTMRLSERHGVDPATTAQAYHASLLMYVGCLADAHVATNIFAGSLEEHMTPAQFGSRAEIIRGVARALPESGAPPSRRIVEVARRFPRAAARVRPQFAAMCEVAELLADGIGLPSDVPKLFPYLTERWDGKGVLGRARADAIPLPIRLMHVARDAAFQRVIGGDAHAVETIRQRAGHAFDPDIARTFVLHASEMFRAADDPSMWDVILAAEPEPHVWLVGEAIDRALRAIGISAEISSPYLAGHSAGVAERAVAGARACGLDEDDVRRLRRAGLLHDVGRVAVHPRVWEMRGPLDADAWEQVRLHAYHVERVIRRSPFLAALGAIACAHHERLDGSGYHRALPAAGLPPPARLLAVADVYQALMEPRAYRPGYDVDQAAEILRDEARAGRLDAEMVGAVLQGAGQPAPRIERPAGLTDREVQVIGLLARGFQTKQVGRALGISVKTADRHIQNAYRKIGVSTRAGAAVFAMEHGLVPWGVLPIADRPRDA